MRSIIDLEGKKMKYDDEVIYQAIESDIRLESELEDYYWNVWSVRKGIHKDDYTGYIPAEMIDELIKQEAFETGYDGRIYFKREMFN